MNLNLIDLFGKGTVGRLIHNTSISADNSVYLINQSVTGLYETKNDLFTCKTDSCIDATVSIVLLFAYCKNIEKQISTRKGALIFIKHFAYKFFPRVYYVEYFPIAHHPSLIEFVQVGAVFQLRIACLKCAQHALNKHFINCNFFAFSHCAVPLSIKFSISVTFSMFDFTTSLSSDFIILGSGTVSRAFLGGINISFSWRLSWRKGMISVLYMLQ